MRGVRAFGPASIGNFIAGFDVLGAAIVPVEGEPLGDWVEVSPAEADSLVCEGPFAHRLPSEPSENLALKSCAAYARVWGRTLPPLFLRLHKGLPVGSGLGSSSATVVATLVALDAFLGEPLGKAGLLLAAGEAESHASGATHLDNVAPALLGGLRLIDAAGQARSLPFPETLRIVVASPELELTTRVARRALPHDVPLSLAVAHAQNLAGLLHALHEGDGELRQSCLRDLLAEPHRAALVHGFREVQSAALEAGAEGCSLSGAGPAVFALAARGRAAVVGEAMVRAWSRAGVKSRVRVCELDRRGARVMEAI